MRQRGERVERPFAHVYDTGGMRRTHLRRHPNILKRLLIHASGCHLGLMMRHLFGLGTPRSLQGRLAAVISALWLLLGAARRRRTPMSASSRLLALMRARFTFPTFEVNSSVIATFAMMVWTPPGSDAT